MNIDEKRKDKNGSPAYTKHNMFSAAVQRSPDADDLSMSNEKRTKPLYKLSSNSGFDPHAAAQVRDDPNQGGNASKLESGFQSIQSEQIDDYPREMHEPPPIPDNNIMNGSELKRDSNTVITGHQS